MEVKVGLFYFIIKIEEIKIEFWIFVVILFGYLFCGLINNISVDDVNFVMGYWWWCSFFEYFIVFDCINNGCCISFLVCDVGVCGWMVDVDSGSVKVWIGFVIIIIVSFIVFFCMF